MNKEITVLREIKSSFGWPVDTLRYGLSSTSRYLYEDSSADVLPVAIQERVRFSLQKAKIAQQLLHFLTFLPWVQMIFITGSVASLNAKQEDDIDVWLIVEPKRIWITRALDFFWYIFGGKRRLSGDGVESERVKDKLCFNFYSTTNVYQLPEQTVSNAMQLVDAIPVFIRDATQYKNFLIANEWIQQIFPSWYRLAVNGVASIATAPIRESRWKIFAVLIDCVDYVAGILMLAKAEKKFVFAPSLVYRPIFTTWGTPRILSRYDQETFPEGSKKSKQAV